jgi:hypothetical protein
VIAKTLGATYRFEHPVQNVGAGFHAKPDDPSIFIHRGGPYPRPETSTITAAGGDKPRPYIASKIFMNLGSAEFM